MAAMKQILIGLLLLLSATVSAVAATKKPVPTADSLMQAAIQTAKAQDKVVLVHFGASWCGWCKRLDEMLQGKELGKFFSKHYVVVHMTVQEHDKNKKLETPGADELLAANGATKSGVPIFMFFNKSGTKVADSLALPERTNIGYPASPEEIQAFGAILDQTAPRMTLAERATVIRYLKAHAPPPDNATSTH